MTGLSFEQFDAVFDEFSSEVFRLETLQSYAVSNEDAGLRAFREGTPRPERSVRTSAWLRRIAVTSARGASWQRVHIVTHPLSEYLRYELVGYVESQAAGEHIMLADRDTHPELTGLGPDFWLFDADTAGAHAVLMRYSDDGEPLRFDYTTDPGVLASCRAQRGRALAAAIDLNTYTASYVQADKVAA
jgi:hypothetical protein